MTSFIPIIFVAAITVYGRFCERWLVVKENREVLRAHTWRAVQESTRHRQGARGRGHGVPQRLVVTRAGL